MEYLFCLKGDRENSLDVLHEQVSIYCENVHCVAIWDAWTSIQGVGCHAKFQFRPNVNKLVMLF